MSRYFRNTLEVDIADKLDALLATAQMPAGVPVATVAVGIAGARNAALLALAILATSDPVLRSRLEGARRAMAEKVEAEPEFLAHLKRMSRQAKKRNQKQFSCVVCGRKFWRTPQTKDRKTCSEDCWHAALRKGLRVGWAARKSGA